MVAGCAGNTCEEDATEIGTVGGCCTSWEGAAGATEALGEEALSRVGDRDRCRGERASAGGPPSGERGAAARGVALRAAAGGRWPEG